MSDSKDTHAVWFRHDSSSKWSKTRHTINAKSDEQAQEKMRRMFRNSGFRSMQLIALPIGEQP